jgi:hypothetical protein
VSSDGEEPVTVSVLITSIRGMVVNSGTEVPEREFHC